MATINYRLIFNELLGGVRDPDELKDYRWMNRAQYVSEFRTIGFRSTRQTGMTNFLSTLVEDGRALLVVILDGMKTNCQNRVREVFKDRVMLYSEFNKLDTLERYANKGIQYICLDEANFVKINVDVYAKLLEVFGENVIVVRT